MSIKIMDVESIRGDEYFTRDQDAETIAQHIIRPMTVWLPFNDRGGAFERVLPAHGHKVICTDGDFFQTDPPAGTQAVISNPPFSRKKDVVKRLDELGLKYALIMPFLWLNDGVPFDYMSQLMMFRKRVHFKLGGGYRLEQAETELHSDQQRNIDARFHRDPLRGEYELRK